MLLIVCDGDGGHAASVVVVVVVVGLELEPRTEQRVKRNDDVRGADRNPFHTPAKSKNQNLQFTPRSRVLGNTTRLEYRISRVQ